MLWCKKCGTRSGGRRVDRTHTYDCYLHDLHAGSLDGGEGYLMITVEKGDNGPADMRAECPTHEGGSLFCES